MDVSEWKGLLNNSAVFSRLTETEIDRLIEVSEQRSFSKAETIFSEGDLGEHVYFIGSGVVTIALAGAGNHKLPIETLGPGDFFGEMACMEHKPRMASVVVESDCELLMMTSTFFHDLVEDNVRFASRFALTLSERLRKLTEEVLAVRVKNVDEKLELSNAKLDASLKAMDSQMKAAETIFEQTSTRASEVIHSFDRTRTQIILAGSVVSIIASLVLGLFIFVGWNEWKGMSNSIHENLKSSADEVKRITETANKIDEKFEKIEFQSAQIDEMMTSVSTLDGLKLTVENARNAQRTLYTVIVRTEFNTIVLEGLDDIYAAILEVADPQLTEELFVQFPRGLMNPNKEINNLYIKLLRSGFEHQYIQTPKQEALSYYYLMAAILLTDKDDRNGAYRVMRRRFDSFIEQHGEPIPIALDLAPSWFEEYISLDDQIRQRQQKISFLQDVWDKITRPRRQG